MFDFNRLLNLNRLQGLFSTNPEQFYGPATPNNEIPITPFDQQVPTLSRGAQDQYANILKQFPTRQPVSTWRKIGAAIAGMGSDNPMETADQFANYKYYNSLKDWSAKAPFFQRAAEGEKAINQQIMNQWMADRKQDEIERYNRERNRISDEANARLIKKDEATADYQRRTLALREFAAKNKSYVFKVRKDGRIIAINPMNPSQLIDTQVDSGELSDIEKANLQLENALELEDVRQTNRQELQTQRDSAALTRKQTSSTTAKSESETQKNQRYTNNATKLAAERPDLAPYMKFEGTGTSRKFVGINPGGGTLNSITGGYAGLKPLSIEDRNLINNRVFDADAGTVIGAKFKNDKNDQVLVINPQGQKGYVPRSQLEAALKQGYKEVK